jgi:small subunit ribosomal protein S21
VKKKNCETHRYVTRRWPCDFAAAHAIIAVWIREGNDFWAVAGCGLNLERYEFLSLSGRELPDLSSAALRDTRHLRMATNVLVTVSKLDDLDLVLKVLKKQMGKEDLWSEMKRREFYTKPSERRRMKRLEALRKARKRRKAQAAYERDDTWKANHYERDYTPSPNYKGAANARSH